jgi:hypothetical protein
MKTNDFSSASSPEPGTLVDDIVTDGPNDFFLVSHKVKQGKNKT